LTSYKNNDTTKVTLKVTIKQKGVAHMVDTAELRGIIAKNGKSQSDVAKMLNITPKTFYMRMKKGVFGSNEIQIMIDELHIDNPMEIFFTQTVTQ